MNVTVLGVDHENQRDDPTGLLGKLMVDQLEKAPVALIAEEAKPNDCTVARRIALGRSIPWRPIDATDDDRIRLGIYDELCNRPMSLIVEDIMMVGQKSQYLVHADAIREGLWVSRILAENVDAALVVCGLLHMETLAERLSARGFAVSQVNACATKWYKEHYGEVSSTRDGGGNLWYEYRWKTPKPIFPP